MLYRIIPFFLLLTLWSCNSDKPGAVKEQAAADKSSLWKPPAAGAVVARYQERVTEDQLNEKYFRVTATTTKRSREGEFQLKLEYGFNINETSIELPQWTGDTIPKPVVRKAEGQYHCQLGFDTGNGQFHELYDIRAENGNVRMKQTKGYFKAQ